MMTLHILKGDSKLKPGFSDMIREPALTMLELLELMEKENNYNNLAEILSQIKATNEVLKENISYISARIG